MSQVKTDADTRWDPDQYRKFVEHRLRPALELLARIPLEDPQMIFDLGCGTGEATRIMAERWPNARVAGLDSSREMLEQARAGGGDIEWVNADVSAWTPDRAPDLIYSNATLHWVANHRALIPRLAGVLKPGGCLGVQVPLSFDAPSHRLMRETLADGGAGQAALGSPELRESVARRWVEDTAVYYDLLSARARSVDIWETEYLQVLEGEDPVLEWVEATGLRPVLNGLDDGQRERFVQVYRGRLRKAYPPRPDGKTLYPFRRLFMVAVV